MWRFRRSTVLLLGQGRAWGVPGWCRLRGLLRRLVVVVRARMSAEAGCSSRCDPDALYEEGARCLAEHAGRCNLIALLCPSRTASLNTHSPPDALLFASSFNCSTQRGSCPHLATSTRLACFGLMRRRWTAKSLHRFSPEWQQEQELSQAFCRNCTGLLPRAQLHLLGFCRVVIMP